MIRRTRSASSWTRGASSMWTKTRLGFAAVGLATTVGLVSAAAAPAEQDERGDRPGRPSITNEPFGTLEDGTEVDVYTLRNWHGMEVKILTYGGILQSISVPDRSGEMANVSLGFDNLDDYVE